MANHVVIVSKASLTIIGGWQHKLAGLGARTTILTVSQCQGFIGATGVSFWIDDVNPINCPENKDLLTRLHRVRPKPVVVVLIDDSDCDRMEAWEDGSFWIHHLSETAADMSSCYRHAAFGQCQEHVHPRID